MTCGTSLRRAAGLLALLGATAGAAGAQKVDVDALISAIDERAGQYQKLTEILQGTDPARALAAFDVMLETGDETMREAAVSAAMSATDERLRARALWETLLRKDSITVTVDTDSLDEEARAALDSWIGAVSTWGITGRFPETQCLNLYRSNPCQPDYHLSVSGLKVDLRYSGSTYGSFALNSEGVLAGQVTNVSSKAVYPATIQVR